MKSPWIDPKISSGFSVIFWSCRLRLFRFALKFSTEIFTPYGWLPPQSGFSEFVVSSEQFCCTTCYWGNEMSPIFFSFLCYQFFFRVDSSRNKFPMRPTFPTLPDPQSEHLLSKFSQRSAHSRERFLVKLSCQIGEGFIGIALKWIGIQPLIQKELLVLWMVLRIVFHREFSRLPGGLVHFADSNSIP